MKFEQGKSYVDREGNEYIYVGENPAYNVRTSSSVVNGGALIFARPDGAIVTRNKNGIARSGLSRYDITAEKKVKVVKYVTIFKYRNAGSPPRADPYLWDTEEKARYAFANSQGAELVAIGKVEWEE